MNRFISRNVVFPSLFFLRRQPVLAHLEALKASDFWSKARLDSLQQSKLRSLIQHSFLHHPYYRQRFDSSGIDPRTMQFPDDLESVPLLEKVDLPELFASAQPRSLRPAPRVLRKTSGSSGDPSVVLADSDVSARSLAARYRFYGWHGIQLGAKEVRFWGRPLTTAKWRHTARDFLLNRQQVDSADLSASRFAQTWSRLAHYSGDYAYGYTSMLAMLTERMSDLSGQKGRLSWRAAVCTTESSTKRQRRRMGEILECPVLNEYGTSETDIIASECPAGSLHVVRENVYVEILDEAGKPSSEGEIIVTDLNNHAMPLIRYRVGDLGSWRDEPCLCGRASPTLNEIEGRVQGQYLLLPDGTKIHSQTVAYAFEELVESGAPIQRFKVVQENATNLRVLIAMREADTPIGNEARMFVQREMSALTGQQMATAIEIVALDDLLDSGRKYCHFESRL